jgi:hypothetical protein
VQPDANAAPQDPAPGVATSAGPVRLSRTPAAPPRRESGSPPLESSSRALEPIGPPLGSALPPLASPSPSSDHPAGGSPGGDLAPLTAGASAAAPAILRLARPATTHPVFDAPGYDPPAADLSAVDPGLPVIRRSVGQPQAAAPVDDRPTGLRRLLAAVTGRRERSGAADAVAISRDTVAGELSPATREPTPVLGARIGRMAAATRPIGLADAGHGEPDAPATGVAPPQDMPSPARLAAVGGATIARSETGTETVTFAPPPGESAAPAPAAATPVGGSAASAAGSTQTAPASDPSRSAAPARDDIDDVYDQVLERLRHDLVTEYERLGHSLDGLPRC